MSESVITYRGTIYPWQCDHMGHMNVMWYVGKFDEASWQLLASIGLSSSRLKKEGIGMAAIDQHIEYKREVRAGDLITIRSAVLEIKEKTIRLIHEMKKDDTGELAATTVIVGICMNTTTRKTTFLPSDLRESAEMLTLRRTAAV
jgi:acyl-CoA thioester hydrolase